MYKLVKIQITLQWISQSVTQFFSSRQVSAKHQNLVLRNKYSNNFYYKIKPYLETESQNPVLEIDFTLISINY